MRRTALITGLVCGLSADALACEGPVPLSAFLGHIDAAEAAWGADPIAFNEASAAGRLALPCLATPLSASVAARVHRVRGLGAIAQKDYDQAARSFAAARSADPDHTWAPDKAPPGGTVLKQYMAFNLAAGASTEVGAPVSGRFFFDGQPSEARPASWPTLVQRVGEDGQADWSAWLQAADPVPAEQLAGDASPAVAAAPAPPPSSLVDARDRPPETLGKSGRVLALSAIGTGLVAGGLYGWAYATASDYRNNPHTGAEYDGLQRQANTLVIASAGTGVVAAGLGLGAVFTGAF